MKILNYRVLAMNCALAAWITAAGQQADPGDQKAQTDGAAVPAKQEAPAAPNANQPPANAPVATPAKAKTEQAGEGTLRMNFRGVPLDMVLDYLSDAAGFIIVKETNVTGKVDAWSNQPLTTDEAVELLNTILNKNDYAAIRNGRTLTIVSREEAKKRNIPVVKGGEARNIPKTDDMVTQIIPVKHANVTQLINNLKPLIGTYAEVSPNESANSLILTATQADVRRITEIINALDDSISSTSGIKVFALKFADAKELANVIKEVFAPAQQQQQGGNRGGFNPFAGNFPGGFRGNAGRGGNAGGNAANGNASGGAAVNARVVAMAYEPSNSVVVAAPEDMMPTIVDMVDRLDQPVDDVTEVRVFRLNNADPLEMADLLSSLFPDDTRSNNNNNQQPFRFFGRGGRGNNGTSQPSDRMKKMGRVAAVPDARTSSLVVSAASELMPQIASMVEQLDSSPARKQKVFVYSLENADVQETAQILQEMFQRNTTAVNRNALNQNSALSTRIQQNNQAISSGMNNNTGFGTGFNGGGLGGGGAQQFR